MYNSQTYRIDNSFCPTVLQYKILYVTLYDYFYYTITCKNQ